MRDAKRPPTSRFGKRRRIAAAESKTVSLAVICSRLTNLNTYRRPCATRSIGSKLSLQCAAKFREGMGNGLRFQITRNDGQKPKQEKEIIL